MSTVPRVSSALPGQPPHFGSVLAHQPAIAARFAELYGAFWASDVVSARVKELCRMRNARVTGCGFCRQVRFDKARQAGLGEDVIGDVTDDYAASNKLTAAEKAALGFTDAIIFDPALFDADARANLHAHFSDAQVAELGIGVSLFLALAKVLIVLGLEPEEMDRTELATPRAPSGGDGASPDLPARLEAFRAAAREPESLDRDLLALAEERVAASHGDGPMPQAPADPSERAVAAFANKMPFDHHAITDAEAAAVREALGDAGFVALAVAAALSDARCRLEQVITREAATA